MGRYRVLWAASTSEPCYLLILLAEIVGHELAVAAQISRLLPRHYALRNARDKRRPGSAAPSVALKNQALASHRQALLSQSNRRPWASDSIKPEAVRPIKTCEARYQV